MKTLIAIVGCMVLSAALAADAPEKPASQTMHRYLIERTFPAGALDGVDAATKAKVNATNAKYGVNWVVSYANADKTKTYCIYEGPNESAIRRAAAANGFTVDSIKEVPVTLESK